VCVISLKLLFAAATAKSEINWAKKIKKSTNWRRRSGSRAAAARYVVVSIKNEKFRQTKLFGLSLDGCLFFSVIFP
jgi:hypothetical protein